ncbi:MAG: PD40 domain-containing protein, partial [Calditrichia bacterium]|nr:PD40 domain-containing protein [Calditrichia bacterium]
MTFLLRILLLISVIIYLMGCGGAKVLTQGEVEQLSPVEKKEYFLKMADKNPEYAENFTSLAKLYLENNENDKALFTLKKGLKSHPSNAGMNFMYGQLAIQQGQNKEGYLAFKTVLSSPEAYSYKDKIGGYVQEKYGIVPVIDSKFSDAYPVFAPNGESVYFQSNRNGNWDIFNFNIISNELTQITFTEADEELPWISHDGKFLYFTSSIDDKRPVSYVSKSRNIYVKNLEDGTETNLTNTMANDWLPRADWQGEKITFVSERKDLREVALTEKKSLVYTMETTGDFQ